ncbi:hypothetical protein [Acinetobacter radioresistens]|uniref:hypothetical protein n=1 Tax=Acinetobacter radioresistens TaxID=40216 RepID=UPI002245A658|nr:hypothetical protein [Acinetobacter radioresistens]MCX0340136.1 hypothetical protein [Acinetobacter radioresistens]
MGIFSSIGSAISSACSSIGSAIGSACSAVIGSISSVMSNAGSLISALAIAIPITGALGKVVLALDIIGKILGVQEPEENTEDIGDRALQAQEAGINPEDYASYKEYSAAIKNFVLDPKKSAEITDLDKKLAGIATQAWAYEEKFGVDGVGLLTKTIEQPDYFTGDRLASFLDKVDSISDVVQYFDGKLSSNERNAVEAKLIEAEKSINPEKTNTDIYKELDTYRHE